MPPMGAHSMVAAGVEVRWTGEGDGRNQESSGHCGTVAGQGLRMHGMMGRQNGNLSGELKC